MDYNVFKNRGLTGLLNLGNTCYINSSLQILSHIPELNEYSANYLKHHDMKTNNDIFLKEWIDLYHLMWKKNAIISPNRFIKVIQTASKEKNNNCFTGFDQNDSTEFMYFIIHIFHDALCESYDKTSLLEYQLAHYDGDKKFCDYLHRRHDKDYSFIDSLFSIYVRNEIVDKDNGKVLSVNFEDAYILDVAVQSLSLNDCLKQYFSDEIMSLENGNQYYDDGEKKYKDVIKKTYLYNSPPYFIVQLKRWNMNLKKNQRIIHYDPKEIDLTPYFYKESPDKSNSVYELFGIINHSGNVFGGHYFSYIKGFNGKWYEFNDAQVKEISLSKLLTNKNYCFIYRRNK